MPAEDGRDNTALALLRVAPTGVPWRVPVLAWPDAAAKPHTHTHRHQNPRQHIPLRDTTAEWLCYDISNQELRQASGFGRPKGTMEEREVKAIELREERRGGVCA